MSVAAPVADGPFVEEAPPAVARKLDAVRGEAEVVHIQVATDMVDDQVYGERWLVATDK